MSGFVYTEVPMAAIARKLPRSLTWMWLALLCAFVEAGFAAGGLGELGSRRINEIAAMLPDEPSGFGRPISDRAFWNAAAKQESLRDVLAEAESLLSRDFPAWDNELYQGFSRNGNRPPGERMIRQRRAWLQPLVLAECIENKGRFLPLLKKSLLEYTREPGWVLPAHDWGLSNFRGEKYTVDLSSSAFGADLAQVLYWLGDRLDPEVRKEVMAAIQERVFDPFKRALPSGKDAFWLGSKKDPVKNNWNAVCLAGVASAARTILPDRRERALVLAAGEHYSRYFINGFRDDGYCDEGAGYWAYGFGDYVLLRETLAGATGGRVDLFRQPKIRKIAEYGVRIRMTDGLAPPFADCRFGTRTDPELVEYCNRTLGLGLRNLKSPQPIRNNQLTFLFMTETVLAKPSRKADGDKVRPDLRSFFEQAGVIVCRPASGSAAQLSAAIKAGGNTSHSHNDIGAFAVALRGRQVVGDPGGPHAYDDKTFGPERYERKMLNSFGHPVPVVAGQLQVDATKVHAKVLQTKFTATSDEIKIDLKPAYNVPELKKLVRTMNYSRAGEGEVVIQDSVLFASPQTFEVAIPTLGTVRRVGERGIEFEFEGQKLIAEVQTPDGFELATDRIEELGAPAFTRPGIKLLKPVTQAQVVVTFRPATRLPL